jgi:DNA-binding beta-propeller fold protein YncE
MTKRCSFPVVASFVFFCLPAFAQTYKLTGSIQIGGTGGWDYLYADSQNGRLYVSHGPEVVVIDVASEKTVGKISGLKGVHGIAVADDLGIGFISDGGNNQCVSFDLKTLEVKDKTATGTNPDGIVYDPYSKQVFTFNGRSSNATAIDATTGKVTGTIALPGKPEFPATDAGGNVFVNIEDKNEIDRIDPKTLTVTAHWPVAPCESPSGLAIDAAGKKLFAVCDGKMMAVVDTDTGKVVATPAIGEGPDAAGYDPGTHLAFSSNGEGSVTVVNADGSGKYAVAQTVKTERGARTMALDSKTHKIYLSAATMGPAPAATAANPHPRPSIVPGSFKILVLSK